MCVHGTPLLSRSQVSGNLCAVVEALLCTWKQTGEMQKADLSDADCPAWNVAAIREMVLLDAQCRQIWQRGDPGGRREAAEAGRSSCFPPLRGTASGARACAHCELAARLSPS